MACCYRCSQLSPVVCRATSGCILKAANSISAGLTERDDGEPFWFVAFERESGVDGTELRIVNAQ